MSDILGAPADLSGLVPVSLLDQTSQGVLDNEATIYVKRSMGRPGEKPIQGFMVVDERGTDRLTITQHPVEQGAKITDHAYLEPAELTMRMMSTAATPVATGNPNYLANLYADLLALQASRNLLQVVSGKRLYPTMLIASIELTTDEKTENALMIQITCREVIIVQTRATTAAPADQQQNPAKTDTVTETGDKQAKPSTAPSIAARKAAAAQAVAAANAAKSAAIDAAAHAAAAQAKANAAAAPKYPFGLQTTPLGDALLNAFQGKGFNP